MTKLLLLGASGLIGHQIYNYFSSLGKYEIFNTSFTRALNNKTILMDAKNEYLFINQIKDIQPKIIINCIGLLITSSSLNPRDAIFLNAYLPHALLNCANLINAKLIHISTDCVFSGNTNQPYKEDSVPDGTSIYARTKALGEIHSNDHLTLRTSVVGPELKKNGEELFHWFMFQHGEIYGYRRAIWSGVSTPVLAEAVENAIINNVTGLHHITNNKIITKFELLNLFKKYTGKKIKIIPEDKTITNKSFLDTRNEVCLIIPEYEEMISNMIDLIFRNNKLYQHYKFS
jgi:dTDP-4-dehydrorhamnose reductase